MIGHTDNQPIRTVRFPSNYQLSAARAKAASDIIARTVGTPSRLSAEGRADADPIASNATIEGREENRRIEVILHLDQPMQPVDKLGKYHVQGTIGRGAVGVVDPAFDPILARPVAIKAIPLDISDDRGRERHARFKREAQAVARMHHPHIVSIYDYGETEELAYIVMERLEGGSLKARIERRELKLPEMERILRDLLNGLHHSHTHGVVHRDIKPANVVFDKDGDLKITDFGVARLDNDNLTKEGSALGTPAVHVSRAGPGRGGRLARRHLRRGRSFV